MIWFVLAALFLFSRYAYHKREEDLKAKLQNTIYLSEKRCPPHKWEWQAVVDQHGNPAGERMACKHCGPLSAMLEKL
jgi:hypothetical protein